MTRTDIFSDNLTIKQYIKIKFWLKRTPGKNFICILDDILSKTNKYEDFIYECKKQDICITSKLDLIRHELYLIYSLSKYQLDIRDSFLPERFRHKKILEKYKAKYRETAITVK
jgi:hypothetical protein